MKFKRRHHELFISPSSHSPITLLLIRNCVRYGRGLSSFSLEAGGKLVKWIGGKLNLGREIETYVENEWPLSM